MLNHHLRLKKVFISNITLSFFLCHTLENFISIETLQHKETIKFFKDFIPSTKCNLCFLIENQNKRYDWFWHVIFSWFITNFETGDAYPVKCIVFKIISNQTLSLIKQNNFMLIHITSLRFTNYKNILTAFHDWNLFLTANKSQNIECNS